MFTTQLMGRNYNALIMYPLHAANGSKSGLHEQGGGSGRFSLFWLELETGEGDLRRVEKLVSALLRNRID